MEPFEHARLAGAYSIDIYLILNVQAACSNGSKAERKARESRKSIYHLAPLIGSKLIDLQWILYVYVLPDDVILSLLNLELWEHNYAVEFL